MGVAENVDLSRVESTWLVVPFAMLRQAGFAFRLLDNLQNSTVRQGVADLLGRCGELNVLIAQIKAKLSEVPAINRGRILSRVGMMLPLEDREVRLCVSSAPAVELMLQQYLSRLRDLHDACDKYDSMFVGVLDESRRAVVAMFADPALRDVLLLSNDRRHADFVAWLDRFSGVVDHHARKMTDLLAMYLQRVCAKNEMHSHFGPITIARMDSTARGIQWSTGKLRRLVFCTHWAGERLAAVFTADPMLRESVRPRRLPLVFAEGGRLSRYAFTTTTGMPDAWRFIEVDRRVLDEDELWLWQHCDGRRSIGELRGAWPVDPGKSFDEVLRGLVEDQWIISEWEIPIGEPFPLRVLTEHLAEHLGTAAAKQAERGMAFISGFERALTDFAVAAPQRRSTLLAKIKTDFAQITGGPANRSSGRHYADRSVVFEEALGEVQDLVLGADLASFLGGELAVVYDMALLAPRLRMCREREILRGWVRRRFGLGVPVRLGCFYAEFFTDREALDEQCAEVDGELSNVDRQLTELLLAGASPGQREVEVPRARLEEFFARYPHEPAALCNPDVMFAARDRTALAAGEFTAVVGDCHSVREVLTHSSVAPVLATGAPELLPTVYAGYLRLLDDDEVLVDLSRSHPDKTGAQLVYPCPDLEVWGRSPKPRDQVLHPDQLYLVAHSDRVELRADGVTGRIRLMAPLAGGPSIRQDPLSPFSFPRHFGGLGLRAVGRPHLPRIRCGRIVLQRERWQIPADRLRGWRPAGTVLSRHAAEFLAACRLREELDLPQCGFVKIPGEPKPVFVDWAAPLLVRQLFRLARKATGSVELTELFPDKEDLWLEHGGERYTSELRCAVFSR
jgi:hypothetical protein